MEQHWLDRARDRAACCGAYSSSCSLLSVSSNSSSVQTYFGIDGTGALAPGSAFSPARCMIICRQGASALLLRRPDDYYEATMTERLSPTRAWC